MENTTGARSSHLIYLDWMRGIAAMLVLLTHMRGGFFVQWSDLQAASMTPLNYVLFLLTRLGREAVIVFFVLSGYLVGGQAIVACRQGVFSFRDYFIARVARLYTVLLPALLLTAAIDSMLPVAGPSGGWREFIVNALFLQGFAGPAFGSNAPLWSLSFEWWFYMVFGIALFAVAGRRMLVGVFALALLAFLAVLNSDFLILFPLWLLGVFARLVPSPKPRSSVFIALVIFCACIAFSSARWDRAGDYAVAVGAAVLVNALRNAPCPSWGWLRWGERLALFSFSLYLTHYPIARIIHATISKTRMTTAGPAQWTVLFVLTTGTAFTAYVFYRLFEQHTSAVRSALMRRHRRREVCYKAP